MNGHSNLFIIIAVAYVPLIILYIFLANCKPTEQYPFYFITGQVKGTCQVDNCYQSSCSGYTCSYCFDGYYLSYYQDNCYKCRDSCLQCSRYSACSECVSHRYGPYCQWNCNDDCKSQACTNGQCTNGCIDGKYLSISGQCKYCQTVCASCSDGYTCTSCKQRKWGSFCQNDCSNCKTGYCYIDNGCSECVDGYYRKYLDSLQGYLCSVCPETCTRCTSQNDCSACQSGYWGSSCQNDCNVCKDSYCQRQNGCTAGCNTGYYQRSNSYPRYCDRCPENCLICTSLNRCSQCDEGYNGPVCQHDCRNCNGQLCNYNTGECSIVCSATQFFEQTLKQCIDCPVNCTMCSSSSYCISCINGHWGITCQSACSQNCNNNLCRISDGRCNGCKDGFYGLTCSEACLSTCETCTQHNSCQSCKDDYFSKTTAKLCECMESECTTILNSACTKCSRVTYYPVTQGCCPCSDRCKDKLCVGDGLCIDCDEGNYGDYCQNSCSTDCKNGLCYRNGSCITCIDGRHGEHCENSCSTNCRDRLCYRNGSCTSCYDGRYGESCFYSCSSRVTYCNNCLGELGGSLQCVSCSSGRYPENNMCVRCNDNCKSGAWPYCNSTSGNCLYGCNDHWFGDKCDSQCNVSKCVLCPSNHNMCEECSEGHYLESSTACVSCPKDCLSNMKCNKNNGSCEDGCVNGKSGIKCNLTCSSGCLQCDQYNVNDCTKCKNGFYGNACEYNCSSQCKVIEETNVCSKSSGWCQNGCNDGYWGSYCNAKCGEGCTGGQCNRTAGECFQGCTYNYYNEMCNERCSENCLDNVNIPNDRKCEESSGRCIYGCLEGWYGEGCEMQCSQHCNRTMCYRGNGTCEFGCITGYVGHDCMQGKCLYT